MIKLNAIAAPLRLVTLLALLGSLCPAHGQNTELRHQFTYFTWELAGLPRDIRIQGLATDAVGNSLATYTSASGDSGGTLLLQGGGWQSLDVSEQLFSPGNGFPQVPGYNRLTGLSAVTPNARVLFVGKAEGGGVRRGFAWSGGSLQGFTVPGAPSTQPQAINYNGQIAGEYSYNTSSVPERGFVLDPHRGFRDVLAPGGRYMRTLLYSINLWGDVAGIYQNTGAGNEADRGAFIATHDGKILYIDGSHVYTEDGFLTGVTALGLQPKGINRSGEVVGTFVASSSPGITRNFYYYNGILRVLDGPPQPNCPNRKKYPQVDPSVYAPFVVSGIDDNGAIHGSADCRYFTGVAPSHPPTPWYLNLPSMQITGPSAHGDTMLAGEVLQGDESITSLNGRYTFTYQADGNVVLYRNADHRALWASNTPRTTLGVAIMQTDGNFVVYNRQRTALFASHTSKNAGTILRVQNDGNVVAYAPNGRALWCTHTVQRT